MTDAAPAAKRHCSRDERDGAVPDAAAIDGWFGRVGLRAHRHQVDAVRAVLRRAERRAARARAAAAVAAAPGAGAPGGAAPAAAAPCRCLLQHATGSGKSLLVAALALALARCARARLVLVVNDRLQLDQQLFDAARRFLSANGARRVVRCASAAALSDVLRAHAGARDDGGGDDEGATVARSRRCRSSRASSRARAGGRAGRARAGWSPSSSTRRTGATAATRRARSSARSRRAAPGAAPT